MCRLFAAYVHEGPTPLLDVTKAFIKACKHDELHKHKGSHRDGWGWLIVTPAHTAHYRSVEPVDVDVSGISLLMKSLTKVSEGFVIAHCRRASKGLKKWVLGTHPSPAQSLSNGYAEVWVAFNGTIPLERLGGSGGGGYVTDTHLIASLLSKHIAVNGLKNGLISGLLAIADAAGPSRGAVVAAISIGASAAHTAVLNHFPASDIEGERYYRAKILREEGAVVTASPTIALYHSRGEWTDLGQDEVVLLGSMRLAERG